jgi:hypothetical protein
MSRPRPPSGWSLPPPPLSAPSLGAAVERVRARATVAVVDEARFKGTHTGALATPQGEVAASGNAIDVPFAEFFRLGDDKFVEHRVYWDQPAMMAQLSSAPPTTPEAARGWVPGLLRAGDLSPATESHPRTRTRA